MAVDDEMTLGEVTAVDDETSRDVTPDGARTASGFDLEAWLAGARPSRRATTVYARPDLLAEIDLLSERVIEAEAARDNIAAAKYMVQVRELREQMRASALDVVVEASSETARDRIREAIGVEAGKGVTADQALQFAAAHIVEPKGMDAEALKRLSEVSQQQVIKIMSAVQVANETAPAVPAPFSLASSNGRRVDG